MVMVWWYVGKNSGSKFLRVVTQHACAAGTGAYILECGPRQCEILPSGVNKGTGVLRLLAHLGSIPAETMAIGDAENDIEMLQVVAVGVAMGNAGEATKAAADFVVATCDCDGVAEAVRRFVFHE